MMLAWLNSSVWLAAAAIAAGGYGAGRLHAWHSQTLRAVEQRADAIDAARETERLANRNNTRLNDARTKADQAAAAANALTAERLRQLASDASEAATACRRLDEPAATILPERTRTDLESLAQRADGTARTLDGLQRYIREVVAPACLVELPP